MNKRFVFKLSLLMLSFIWASCGSNSSQNDDVIEIIDPINFQWLDTVNVTDAGTENVNVSYVVDDSSLTSLEFYHSIKVQQDSNIDIQLPFKPYNDQLSSSIVRNINGGELHVQGSYNNLQFQFLEASIEKVTVELCTIAKVDDSVVDLGCVEPFDISGVEALYTIGLSISGLNGQLEFSLQINSSQGGSFFLVDNNGTATLPGLYPTGTSYRVDLGTMPSGQTCVVNNATGVINNADVTDIAIVCTTN